MRMCVCLNRYPDSRLARMFSGQIPVVLDSLKQHYFIDRDGAMFRHVLNFLRSGDLALADDFNELDMLLDEARFYDIGPLVDAVETLVDERNSRRTNRSKRSRSRGCVANDVNEGEDDDANVYSSAEYNCVTVTVHPELNERISLNAERSVLDEVFPEVVKTGLITFTNLRVKCSSESTYLPETYFSCTNIIV